MLIGHNRTDRCPAHLCTISLPALILKFTPKPHRNVWTLFLRWRNEWNRLVCGTQEAALCLVKPLVHVAQQSLHWQSAALQRFRQIISPSQLEILGVKPVAFFVDNIFPATEPLPLLATAPGWQYCYRKLRKPFLYARNRASLQNYLSLSLFYGSKLETLVKYLGTLPLCRHIPALRIWRIASKYISVKLPDTFPFFILLEQLSLQLAHLAVPHPVHSVMESFPYHSGWGEGTRGISLQT